MTSHPVNSEETETTIEQMARAMATSWGYRWEPCENGCDEMCDCLATEGDDDWERPSQADFLKAARAALVVASPPVRETLPESEDAQAASSGPRGHPRENVCSECGYHVDPAHRVCTHCYTTFALPPETGS